MERDTTYLACSLLLPSDTTVAARENWQEVSLRPYAAHRRQLQPFSLNVAQSFRIVHVSALFLNIWKIKVKLEKLEEKLTNC